MRKFMSLSDSQLRLQVADLEEELARVQQQNRADSAAKELEYRLSLLELRVEWLERQ